MLLKYIFNFEIINQNRLLEYLELLKLLKYK